MQPVRLAKWTPGANLAGAGVALGAGWAIVVGVLPGEVTPTPPNPTAKASAAALPNIAIFLVPVIGFSCHVKLLPMT
jgi:hypothetical protein